jgi:hypothetical protein
VMMIKIDSLIEMIPDFRMGLIRLLDPFDAFAFRQALGGKSLFSDTEKFQFADVHAVLGLSLKWVKEVNELGYAVVVLGKDLIRLNDWITTRVHPWVRSTNGLRVLIMCVRQRSGRGPRPTAVDDLRQATGSDDVQGTNGGTIQRLERIVENVTIQVLMLDRVIAESVFLNPHMTSDLVKLPNLDYNSNMSRYTSAYTWTDFCRFPARSGRIRSCWSRYTIMTSKPSGERDTTMPVDYTIYDDDDAGHVTISSIIRPAPRTPSRGYESDPRAIPTLMTIWPPNQTTFWCQSGVYSTSPDPVTRKWVNMTDATISGMSLSDT